MLYSDDEDDKTQNFMAYQAIRVSSELGQFLSPSDFYRIFMSPTATANTFTALDGLVRQALFYDLPYELGIGNIDRKDVFYQRSTNGYKKGQRKIRKKFFDAVPFVVGYSKSGRPEDAIDFYNQPSR